MILDAGPGGTSRAPPFPVAAMSSTCSLWSLFTAADTVSLTDWMCPTTGGVSALCALVPVIRVSRSSRRDHAPRSNLATTTVTTDSNRVPYVPGSATSGSSALPPNAAQIA